MDGVRNRNLVGVDAMPIRLGKSLHPFPFIIQILDPKADIIFSVRKDRTVVFLVRFYVSACILRMSWKSHLPLGLSSTTIRFEATNRMFRTIRMIVFI